MAGNGFVDPTPILKERYREAVADLDRRFADRKGPLWHLVYTAQRWKLRRRIFGTGTRFGHW
jgi:hypothetical protein